MNDPRFEAAQQLEALEHTRQQMAGHMKQAWWERAGIGLCMGAIVMAMNLPIFWMYLLESVAAAGGAFLYVMGRRKRGFFVSGYREGSTRRVAVAIVLMVYALMAVSALARFHIVPGWVTYPAALMAVAVGFYGCSVWQRAYVADMKRTL